MLNIICGIIVYGITLLMVLGFIGMVAEEVIISMKHYVWCKENEEYEKQHKDSAQ